MTQRRAAALERERTMIDHRLVELVAASHLTTTTAAGVVANATFKEPAPQCSTHCSWPRRPAIQHNPETGRPCQAAGWQTGQGHHRRLHAQAADDPQCGGTQCNYLENRRRLNRAKATPPTPSNPKWLACAANDKPSASYIRSRVKLRSAWRELSLAKRPPKTT
jgi:hypothetical protein